MSGLEETFYIMAIIFMSLCFAMMIALVVAVFVIRSKINKIHALIEEKINAVSSIVEKSGKLAANATSQVLRSTKKAFSKSKR